MILKDHDLKQIDKDYLGTLDPDKLLEVSFKLLDDLKESRDRLTDFLRNTWPHTCDSRHLRRPMLVEDALRSGSGVGRLPCQHFVEHAPEAIEIASGIDVASRRQLGAHVGRGPNGHTRSRKSLAAFDGSSNSKIGDDRFPSRQQDVLWLDVSM